jgi:hypothetical protein
MAVDFLCFNRINGDNGSHDLPTMTGQELSSYIKGG